MSLTTRELAEILSEDNGESIEAAAPMRRASGVTTTKRC